MRACLTVRGGLIFNVSLVGCAFSTYVFVHFCHSVSRLTFLNSPTVDRDVFKGSLSLQMILWNFSINRRIHLKVFGMAQVILAASPLW